MPSANSAPGRRSSVSTGAIITTAGIGAMSARTVNAGNASPINSSVALTSPAGSLLRSSRGGRGVRSRRPSLPSFGSRGSRASRGSRGGRGSRTGRWLCASTGSCGTAGLTISSRPASPSLRSRPRPPRLRPRAGRPLRSPPRSLRAPPIFSSSTTGATTTGATDFLKNRPMILLKKPSSGGASNTGAAFTISGLRSTMGAGWSGVIPLTMAS